MYGKEQLVNLRNGTWSIWPVNIAFNCAACRTKFAMKAILYVSLGWLCLSTALRPELDKGLSGRFVKFCHDGEFKLVGAVGT